MNKLVLLLYAVLVMLWVAVSHLAVSLVVTQERYGEVVTERAEDVVMMAGAIGLVLLAAQHAGRRRSEFDAARAGAAGLLRARAAQQAAVAALGQRALERTSSRELADEAVETVRRTLGVDACSVIEHVPDDGGFRMRATSGLDQALIGTIVALDSENTMSGLTVRTGQPLFVTDWDAESRFERSKLIRALGLASAATTPIRARERPYGVLSVCTNTRRVFTTDDAAFLTSVANVLAAAQERERVENEAARFFDMSQDLLAITDFHGVIRRVNPALKKTLGDGHDPVGRCYLDFVHPEDREASRAEALLARPGVVMIENRAIAPDGTYRRIEWSIQADRERGLVYSVARDVTERRRMESDHALLARAVQQAAETVVITGPDAVIAYVNPAFERVTGYTSAEVVGKRPSILKSGKHDAAFYAKLWKTLVAGDVWAGRFMNRRRSGETYEAEGTISPVVDAAGKLVNYVAVMRDVSSEAALQAQFHQAQKMEVVGRLAGGVAHDFNNLLCVIDGYGDMLARELPETGNGRAHVAQILTAADRASVLTKQLLAFSRKQEMQPRILDLNATVRESSKMWGRLLGEDVRIETDLQEDLGRVRADPGQIDQVLMNLAVNARDAMPRGGTLTMRTSNVEIDAAFAAARPGLVQGRYVRVTVRDTGVGMDAATMSRIFEPFFTTKPVGKGSGLGLATVFGIVKQSDGHVEAESEPGRGAAFHVYLPRVDREVSAQELRDPAGGAGSPSGAESVLVVEDDRAVRALLCTILSGAGYRVVGCDGGAEAVAAASAPGASFDLLVADVVMPGADGPETARRITELSPGVRVLYVSGHAFEMLGQRGVGPDGYDLVLKPFTPGALLRKVRAVLDAPVREPEGIT